MFRKQNAIILQNSKGNFRVLKITPHSDGGFDVHFPYCDIKGEFDLGSINIPIASSRSSNRFLIPISDMPQKFKSKSKIKLSIHQSGFTQFSGHGITSGINQKTGEVKGLGLKSKPLSTPINTGPTFGIVLWGLEHFRAQSAFDLFGRENKVVIPQHEYFCEENPLVADGYSIHGFVIPTKHARNISLDVWGPKFVTKLPAKGNKLYTLRPILLPKSNIFIALVVEKMHIEMDKDKPVAGFIVGSSQEINKDSKGRVWGKQLIAAYPKGPFSAGEKLVSLDKT
jgi:hypothetical protein